MAATSDNNNNRETGFSYAMLYACKKPQSTKVWTISGVVEQVTLSLTGPDKRSGALHGWLPPLYACVNESNVSCTLSGLRNAEHLPYNNGFSE